MPYKLYIGGLSYSTTSESLKQHFSQCGTVEAATVITDRFSGQSRGFGFVEMATEVEAQAAIATLNNQPFEGRRLTVSVANSQGPRQGGGSRGEGGSRPGGGSGGQRRPPRW